MDFSKFKVCPRCGEQALEHLESYCHCVNCNFSPELEERNLKLPLEIFEDEEMNSSEVEFWALIESQMRGVA